VKILKRGGVDAVTTNRIAQVAGVSIGSVYQYFPDKRAIFLALHDRHAEEVARLIDATVVAHADSPLEGIVRALVEALIDAHAPDPELYALLDAEVPHRGAGAHSLRGRLRNALRLALGAHRKTSRSPHDLERTLFVVAHMIEALSHGVVLDRPRQLSVSAAKDETVKAVLAYLRS
jgi:AcrR family transcriptional regulator